MPCSAPKTPLIKKDIDMVIIELVKHIARSLGHANRFECLVFVVEVGET